MSGAGLLCLGLALVRLSPVMGALLAAGGLILLLPSTPSLPRSLSPYVHHLAGSRSALAQLLQHAPTGVLPAAECKEASHALHARLQSQCKQATAAQLALKHARDPAAREVLQASLYQMHSHLAATVVCHEKLVAHVASILASTPQRGVEDYLSEDLSRRADHLAAENSLGG